MIRIVYLFFLLCFFVMPASAAPDQNKPVLDIQTYASEQGYTVWLVEDHSLPLVTINFAFTGAGSIHETQEKQGLVRLLSNMMREGAGELDSQAFRKTLDDLSIWMKFENSRDDFYGYMKTLTRNRDKAFELLTLTLKEPRFDEDALTRMKSTNLSRIKSSMTNPKWVAARVMNDRAFENHPYALNSGGTLSSIPNITRDDLQGFKNKHLTKNNLHISVVGDITMEELKPYIKSAFDHLPSAHKGADLPEIRTIQNAGDVYLVKKEIPQTVVHMYQKGISRDHPDYHIASVMNYVLGASGFGSRLMAEARETRGLTYGIYSFLSGMEQLRVLGVSTSTKNESAREMLDIINDEFKRMKSEPISDAELTTAKEYLIGSLPLQFTTSNAVAGTVMDMLADGLPVDYLDRRVAEIRDITKEDVMRVSKDLLEPENFITVLVGNPESIVDAQIIEHIPNVE